MKRSDAKSLESRRDDNSTGKNQAFRRDRAFRIEVNMYCTHEGFRGVQNIAFGSNEEYFE